jgi:hypothetical protein
MRAVPGADLAIIVVSTNEASWLPACLSSVYEHAGDLGLDVVIVDNASSDGTRELVEGDFPHARVVASENHGFPHANNEALFTCSAPFVLFLNPDTEILDGELARLVTLMRERERVGVVGVRQLHTSGELWPTIRRFPNALRALGEALGAERLPIGGRWLRERELDPAAYDRETPCDWTSGSFLLARDEALRSAGYMDERMFLYSDEPDLCLRVKRAGWDVLHVPYVTIAHHARETRGSPRLEAQAARSRLVYARKHLSPLHRAMYVLFLGLRYGLRALPFPGEEAAARRASARAALRALAGLDQTPFEEPPPVAVRPRRR